MPVQVSDRIKPFLSSASLNEAPQNLGVALDENYKVVSKLEDFSDLSDEERFLAGLSTLLFNVQDEQLDYFNQADVQELLEMINILISERLNDVMHRAEFQDLESTWRSIEHLIQDVNFLAGVKIDLLDASKEELAEDFKNNAIDIFRSALFQKVYIEEYDQYGGEPYGVMLGLYEFKNTPDDMTWLRTMAKIGNACHAPFISSIHPRFFGVNTAEEVTGIKDLAGMLSHPKYGRWNALRETEEAAYLGLTFPRYVLRLPYNPDANPCRSINFVEKVAEGTKEGLEIQKTDGANRNADGYLWGSSSVLLVKNLIRSFETSGWCQHIRGPKGGGLVDGLPTHSYMLRGRDDFQLPVELVIPDFRELELANLGFIPLIYKKGSAQATFFSVQSAKRPARLKDPHDAQNSQLVCNLAYTLSVTRIAHYIKCIMRDNIGSTADDSYIQRVINNWLGGYVTTVMNPDDLTLRYYPFKAIDVQVEKREGQIGFYDCTVSVLPHMQFEGSDVELRIESRLG